MRCCSSRMRMQAHMHMGWEGGPCMSGFPVVSGRGRAWKEQSAYVALYHRVGDAVNNLKSTHFSNSNSHLYPLLGCY